MQMEHLPRCPVCGASSLTPEAQMGALLAVCDVLVVKALEQLGKRIVRGERSRFRLLGTRPWYTVHTIWPPLRTRSAMCSRARGTWCPPCSTPTGAVA